MMWRFGRSSKPTSGGGKEPWQARTATWILSHLQHRLAILKIRLLKHLEGIDASLSNRQRKGLFYMAVLCAGGFLFYLLGTALREPQQILPVASVPPASGQVQGQGQGHGADSEKVNVIDFSLLKINSNGKG